MDVSERLPLPLRKYISYLDLPPAKRIIFPQYLLLLHWSIANETITVKSPSSKPAQSPTRTAHQSMPPASFAPTTQNLPTPNSLQKQSPNGVRLNGVLTAASRSLVFFSLRQSRTKGMVLIIASKATITSCPSGTMLLRKHRHRRTLPG